MFFAIATSVTSATDIITDDNDNVNGSHDENDVDNDA